MMHKYRLQLLVPAITVQQLQLDHNTTTGRLLTWCYALYRASAISMQSSRTAAFQGRPGKVR